MFWFCCLDSLFIVALTVEFCVCFMFCCAVLCVFSNFAIILMGKRELASEGCLSSCCLVTVIALWLCLTVSWVICSASFGISWSYWLTVWAVQILILLLSVNIYVETGTSSFEKILRLSKSTELAYNPCCELDKCQENVGIFGIFNLYMLLWIWHKFYYFHIASLLEFQGLHYYQC